jgi:hypothetical protein
MVQKELVWVYRWSLGDCTNYGITSKHDSLYLYSGDRDECMKDAEKEGIIDKALWLNKRILWGEKHYFAEPLVLPDIDGLGMMGGNYVCSCDSRYGRMIEDPCSRPLPVHDRFETWAQYEALSR